MKKWVALLGFVGVLAGLVGMPKAVLAGNGPVIYQLQTSGGVGLATQEFVSIYNNSDQPVDVTSWCVVYTAATTLGCVAKPDANTTVMLPARKAMTLASSPFIAAHAFAPDITFSAGMADTDRYVRLLNGQSMEIDRLGWGAASLADGEGTAAASHGSGKVLQRLAASGQELKDTNNNATDFAAVPLILPPASGLYEVYTPSDVCPNLDGLQITVPPGYLVDGAGNCQPDVCANLDGLQLTVPAGYERLDGENCTLIPLENAVLTITELLPNATSYDTGNEFIEIYNPNNRPINLSGYTIQLGPEFTKVYVLSDQIIAAGTYLVFSDTQTGLILPNSSASLRLVAPSGDVVSLTASYEQPGDNSAWGLIDGFWQYTNQPTPGAANLSSLSADDDQAEETNSSGSSALVPCRADQERNPDTNRCRLIATAAASLVACGPGQERNPATNRCRSLLIATNDLVPCKEGQERNPETNRCRSIASTANALVPCAAGQERNPETNRCRKSTGSGATGIAGVKDVDSGSMASQPKWLLVGLAVIAAVGYALYEWRQEMLGLLGKTRAKLTQAMRLS